MKTNRTWLFVAISSLALFIVLVIQVNWIFRTAKIKEELFNEKANMVLSRTTDALRSDKETCRKIGACAELDSSPGTAVKLGANEVHKIDSLFRHYMRFYNFHIGYSFVITKPGSLASINETGLKNYTYNKALEDEGSKNEIELKLTFPEKKQFMMAEMGPLFITSVILILVVLVLFWRTILSLIREQKISEHTTDFLNNMTHEFKTPLTNIALAGKMILKDPAVKEGAKIKHYSGIILEENEKLRLQVEQVLSMTALERGEIPLRKTELDFHGLIREALQCMSIQIENRQGRLNLTLDADRFVVTGDRTHLVNAMCNLVDNAIKYSGEKPELSVQTSNSGKNIIVVVSDKGIGIEKEFQKQVFDKFFRVPTGDVHDVKGFGLGLAYIKKIVEFHAGTIELQSEKGNGTTFTMTFPNV
ncbi:MAG: HAMP domain-containing sensor histidine kinase [Bacteroidetes bacterium]|nr:HAMP domain-containing sensor histidine kinase [Bacteroidota bacterium]